MKKNKLLVVLGIISLLLILGNGGYFIYNIFLLSGIETYYRIIGILIILFILFLLGKGIITNSIKKMNFKKSIIIFIISIILSAGLLTISIIINKVYSQVDNINKDYLTYSSSLITFDEKYKDLEDLKKTKIGLVDDKNDVENYQIPNEIIKDEKLEKNNEIKKYDDAIEMLNDLYAGEIDAAFVSSNYSIIYSNMDGFEDIKDKAIVITKKQKNLKKAKEEKEVGNKTLTEPFTILLLGVDSEIDGLNPNLSFNGDTIMLISFNPDTLTATMFSIPRDTYVPISCSSNRINKINTAAYGGSKCMVKTIENLTGIPIDYYVKINFKGVVNLVDALGGIKVDVPKPDFPSAYCVEDSNRVTYGTCIKEGYQTLNGEQALALARIRKAFNSGDFQRGKNQQLVVEGMMNQLKTIKSAKEFYNILNTITKNIDTNLTTNQILSFYDVGKNLITNDDNNVINIQKTFLNGYTQSVWEPGVNRYVSIVQYYKNSLKEIVKAMNINLGKEEEKPIKEMSFSINDPYERTIIGSTATDSSKAAMVPNLIGSSESYAKNWASNNGLSVTTEKGYDSNYSTGVVIGQSVHIDTLVMRVSSINFVINGSSNSTSNSTPQEVESNHDNNDSNDNEDNDSETNSDDDSNIIENND